MTHLEGDHPPPAVRLIKLESAVEVVGRLLVVIEHEVSAHRAHLVGESQSHTPARQIYLMHALISQIAIPVPPVPMPVVMKAILRERVFRSGAHPEVVINARRHWLYRRAPDCVAPLVAKPTGHVRVADYTIPQLLHRLP